MADKLTTEWTEADRGRHAMRDQTRRAIAAMMVIAIRHFGGDPAKAVITICRPAPWETRRKGEQAKRRRR